ncbi:MAG: hypothetical protein RLZZ488_1940 [Pseudomonadota bacterium]
MRTSLFQALSFLDSRFGSSFFYSIALTSAFALVSVSCGRGTRSFSMVKNVPGEDSSLALLLGQGLNPVENKAKGHCVTLGGLKTQSGNVTGEIAEFRLLEITSESRLRESLNVSASASFGGLTGAGYSGRMSFAQSINKNSQSKYLMVHTRVANQLEIAADFSFTPETQVLVKSSGGDAFARQCGSEFVYGRRTGGEFFAIFEFSFSSVEEERQFSAALSAAGVGWKASQQINTALSHFNMNARTHVKMYRQGGNGELPEVENLQDFARKFPTLVSGASGAPVTLELITKDYSGVSPLSLKPNPQVLTRQQYVMQRLAENRDQATELARDLRYVLQNPTQYPELNSEQLSSWEKSINIYINNQNDAAVDCMSDAFGACKMPDVSFPAIELPARVLTTRAACGAGWSFDDVGKKCCQVFSEKICTIPDGAGKCLAWSVKDEKICRN